MHTILSIFISLSLLSPAFLPMASQFSVLAENETPAESDNPSPDASMPDASNPDAASDASAPGRIVRSQRSFNGSIYRNHHL